MFTQYRYLVVNDPPPSIVNITGLNERERECVGRDGGGG